ncbi:hypothetical protein [Nonomuraea sp. NEAU-A123]|nr:hypothetical protein [Nonomuraea sp. NEAU-A123]
MPEADVADLRKVLDGDKRLTLIVSLLHTTRTGVADSRRKAE